MARLRRVCQPFSAAAERSVGLAPRAGLVAATGVRVDRLPRAFPGFLSANPALFVAFLNLFGLAFLLVRIGILVTTRHGHAPKA